MERYIHPILLHYLNDRMEDDATGVITSAQLHRRRPRSSGLRLYRSARARDT